MGWGTGNLGGDVGGLNFKVVGGTSAPSNPKENTIWVNTGHKITSWIFSATEPESPSEGTVWIMTGTTSTVEFNALKKKGLQVYPLSAKQYVSGAWEGVTAKSYQGGKWIEWILYLYNEGDLCEDVTGGLVSEAKQYDSNTTGANALTITKNTASIKIAQNGANSNGIAYTKNKIDLTSFKTLYIKGTIYVYEQEWRGSVRIWSNIGTYASDNMVLSRSGNMTDGTMAIDVSSLTGSYHIGVSLFRPGSSTPVNYVEIKKMWLE